MPVPELIMVAGCNAAGKSSFIRTRLSGLTDFTVIMTDVYKNRTKEVFFNSLKNSENIILETVFNDMSFKDLVDSARQAGYKTSLIVLFLDTISQCIQRVAFRKIEENGLIITGGNIRINFNESFKNIATYFFYFDYTAFIYTGITNQNIPIISLEKSKLIMYKSNDLAYPQKFAAYAHQHERLNDEAYQIIIKNDDYE